MACGRPMDLVREEWIGDEDDGCYVRLYKNKAGKYEVEIVMDSETGSFVDTLATLGEFGDEDEAMICARGVATEWCIANDVDFASNL